LREALVKSLNLVSVRILRGTGISAAINHIKPFGLPDSALPRDLSLALGSGGASPWDIAASYATFANGGHRVRHYLLARVLNAQNDTVFEASPNFVCSACVPFWLNPPEPAEPAPVVPVEDPNGQTIPNLAILPDIAVDPSIDDEVPFYESFDAMVDSGLNWRPTYAQTPNFLGVSDGQAPRIITAENAYLIYDMMRDVIQRGTGRRARELGRPDLAGKTGTSNDRRDAWFSGYNGDIVATAWVGFDQDRSLGAGEEGSRTALPIWKYFMKAALAGTASAEIPRPTGIITARIVPESGLVAPAGYDGAIFELFREGNVPEMDQGDAGPNFTPGDLPGTIDDDEGIF
jgi:penicillin-binding protein 1A